MALSWIHAQILLYELCEPTLLRYLLIVLGFCDILSCAKSVPGHENSSWLGADVYFGSFEVWGFHLYLAYGTCSSVGPTQSGRSRGVSVRKENKTKASFIPKRFITTLNKRGRGMTSRTYPISAQPHLYQEYCLVFTRGYSALGLFVLACIFLCNSIRLCLRVLDYKSLNARGYSLPSSSLLMPLVSFPILYPL